METIHSLEDNSQYSQDIYLTKNLYPEYIKKKPLTTYY